MIITLCGSTRFEGHFHAWNEALTLAGHTVFSLSVFPSTKGGDRKWYAPEMRIPLDLAHFAKISASDAILLLNVDGYVGESTQRDVAWAKRLDKKMWALESWGEGCSPAPHDCFIITSRGGFYTNPYGDLAPRGRWANDPREEL